MEDEKKLIICRVCLYNIAITDKYFYLFQQYEDILSPGVNHDDVVIAEKIVSITKVEMREGDGLPSRICTKCHLELEAAYEFKRKCEKSDDILRLASGHNSCRYYQKVIPDTDKETSDISADDYFDNETFFCAEPQDEDVKPDPQKIPVEFENEEDIHSKVVPKENQEGTDTDVIKKSKAIDLKLVCDRCKKTFKSKCKMRVHWKRDHNTHTCPSCKLVFKSIKAYLNHQKKRTKFCLNAHKLRIEGEGKNISIFCNECGYNSHSRDSVLTHLIVHTKEKQYKCDQCQSKFSQLSSLCRHKEFKHKLFPETTKTCHACGEIIVGQYKFIEHMSKKHGKMKTCTVCKKEISARYIQNHMRIHSGIKSYICKICSKAFIGPSNLCNHMKNKHQPYEYHTCKVCGYKSKNYYKLRNHEKSHNDSNVACKICGYFVHNKEELDLHMKRHADKPHKCEHCSKSFCLRKCLTQHYRDTHKIFVSKQHSSRISGNGKRVSRKHKIDVKCESDTDISSE